MIHLDAMYRATHCETLDYYIIGATDVGDTDTWRFGFTLYKSRRAPSNRHAMRVVLLSSAVMFLDYFKKIGEL